MTGEKDLLAPCGLYCGACGIRLAHLNEDQKLKERLSGFYCVSPEQIRCRGCLSDDVFDYCKVCAIKSCNTEKGYSGCHECEEFPCERIDNFPAEIGKKVILRAVPFRRENGDEAWVKMEEDRYLCPNCRSKVFRGARRCRKCGTELDLD